MNTETGKPFFPFCFEKQKQKKNNEKEKTNMFLVPNFIHGFASLQLHHGSRHMYVTAHKRSLCTRGLVFLDAVLYVLFHCFW